MKNLLTIVLISAALLISCTAHSQIKGEAACRKFLQEDFFKRLNDWSVASSAPNPSAEEVSKRYNAVTQVLAVSKIGSVDDRVSAENPHGDGWFAFFTHLVEDRNTFHCNLVSARAICESRAGVWMQVEFELRYSGKKIVVYDYMRVQNMPFGSLVNMISANPPNDCVFDPASYITVTGRLVDELGNTLSGYSVAVKNTYTAQVPEYEVKFRNENFYIENVPPFSALEFTKPGYDALEVPVNNKQDLEILKMKKSPISLVTVTGHVVDELGIPLSGFSVAVIDSVSADNQYNVTYRNDCFVAADVPVKSVLRISRPGYDTLYVAVGKRTDLGIVKLDKTPVTVIRVSGQVITEIGDPLEDYIVMVKDPSVEDYFVTFRKENFVIGDIPHDATLIVAKVGYDTLEVPVDYRTDVGAVKLKKSPLTIISVTGKVVDEIGNSITNFTVTVNDSVVSAEKDNVTYKNDVFTIARIPIDGSFVVTKPGYEPEEVEVKNRTDVRYVKMKQAPLPIIRVSGKVLDEFGNSLSDYMVSVIDTAARSRSYYEISAHGEDFVIGKTPFNASVRISKPGYAAVEMPVDNRSDLGIVKLAKAPTAASMIKGSFTETVNGVPFNMVMMMGGEFMMGATSEQAGDAGFIEKPEHKVVVGDFLIGQTELTLRVWKAVMGSAPQGMAGMDTSQVANNKPVVNVSWDEAAAFAARLGAITGRGYRLLTEAEWEYAARGGSLGRQYKYSGGGRVDDVAWFDGNSDKRVHNVGLKAANESDLYDMSGNVWEWCQDEYRDYDAPDYSPVPAGNSQGGDRVYRGGGCGNEAGYCRVSYRHYLPSDYRNSSLGFRIALSVSADDDK